MHKVRAHLPYREVAGSTSLEAKRDFNKDKPSVWQGEGCGCMSGGRTFDPSRRQVAAYSDQGPKPLPADWCGSAHWQYWPASEGVAMSQAVDAGQEGRSPIPPTGRPPPRKRGITACTGTDVMMDDARDLVEEVHVSSRILTVAST